MKTDLFKGYEPVHAPHFLQFCMCAQRRLRSACASPQSIISESSQGTLWVAKYPKHMQADIEDSIRLCECAY